RFSSGASSRPGSMSRTAPTNRARGGAIPRSARSRPTAPRGAARCGRPRSRNPPIREIEADRIWQRPSVRCVTRRDESSRAVEFADQRLEAVNVAGLSAQWVEVNGGDVYPGRTFTRLEDLANSPVAVINRKLEDQLFRGRDPIGHTIHVAGAPFTVIGVYTPPPSLFSGSTPPFVGIPHGAFAKHVPYFKGWMRLAESPRRAACCR